MSTSYMQQGDDFESFIDFNGGVDSANYAPEDSQPLSGPSFEYDRFRQQTGFPSGSMSNVAAYNDMSIDTDPTTDFAAYNSGMNFDMDFERTPQTPAFFYPSTANVNNNTNSYVDPTAIYDQQPQAPLRMYPGMHSQQAAAALAKQNQQMGNAQFSSQSSDASSSLSRRRAGSQTASDSIADRKISDILENMRQKTAISPIDEEDGDDENGRSRKDEEDMDDDERLLASEEGKKLSSKERRQLRNKVSARAFRSRRKEYISQLEGDLANKASEVGDLKLYNRKLLEENNQLKNLTRTLLSHPAFQTFLEDMSRTQTFVPPPANMLAPVQHRAPEVKQEAEPQQQQQQQQQQQEDTRVNMAQMPQESLNLSMLNLGGNSWGGQNSGYNYQQPRVF